MPEGFTPAPDDLDEIRRRLKEQEGKKADFTEQSNVFTETENPDDAAYDVRKSMELGIPREAISGARDEYKAEDTLRKMQEMRERAPRTSEWLAAPENYAVARDDADQLGGLERAFITYLDVTQTGKAQQALATFGPAMEASMAGVALSSLEAPGLTPFDAAIMANLDKVRGLDEAGAAVDRVVGAVRTPKIPSIRNPFAKAKVRVPEAVSQFPAALSRARDRASANALEAALSANARLEAARPKGVTPESQAVLSGLGSMTEMGPALAAGFLTRNAQIPTAIMGRQVYGQSYIRGREEGLSPGGAALYAGAQSGIERATERLGLEILFGKNFVGKEVGKRLLASLTVEQVQEQFATLGQDFVDWQVLNQEKTFDQFLEERGPAAYQTAIATLVASGPTNAAVLGIEKTLMEMGRLEADSRPSEGQRRFGEILDKVSGSKLAKRSPEKMAEYVGKLTDGTEVETMVVDLDGVVEALEQAGVDPVETLEALGVDGYQAMQNWERFGEIEVKTSTLVTSPAMTAHRAAIEPHVKAKQDAATPAQKEALRADFEAALKDGAAQIQGAIDAGKTTAEKVAQVRESLKARILGAGIYPAGPQAEAMTDAMTAMLTTLPQRTGQDVLDFYAAKAPKIQGVMEGEVMAEEGVLGSEAGTPNNDERLAFFESMPDVIESARAHSIKIRGNAENVEADLSNPAFLERQYLEGLKNKRKELNDKAQDANNAGDVDSYNDFADQADAVRAQIVAEEARQKQVTALNRNNPDQSDSADLLGQELPAAEMQTLDAETQEAITDPQTDVLPLTDDMQVMDLDEFVAFHGTLAKFDKFETDKIGAGEGAQAFGPGHYFTQSRGIADWYRKRMKTLSPGIRMGKEPFNKANPAHFAMSEYWRFRNKNLYHSVFGGYKPHTSDSVHWRAIEQAVWALEFEIKQIENPMTYPGGVISDYATPDRPVIRDSKELVAFLKAGIEHLRSLDPESSKGIPRPSKPVLRGGGSIYTVAVKLPAEQTIQYDKPFGQQPAAVQKAFREAAEAGHLGKAGAALAKYGDATRMDVLVAALKNMKSPAMDVMRANGIRGVRYLDGMSRGKKNRAGQSYNYVVFNDGDVKILDREGKLFQKMMDQQRRGQYAPRTNVITLFEQADITTLMHEAAHWYLETLYSMSIEPDAHPFVVEQYEAIRKWGKVGPDFRMYDDMGRLTPEAVELHESFAETFEVYLQTGKAPSASLRSAFQAFKKWITQLWKRMYGGGQPERANLNPEIVAVMDRMLAVDEEIDAQVEGIIRSAEQQADELLKRGIITKRQRDTAIMNLETAREGAKEDLMARLMEAKMREDEAWWNTERARVRRDVLREFDRSPVGRALSWLGYGQWKGDVPVGEETPGEFDDELYQAYELARPDVDLDQFALSAKQREIAQMILDGAAYADIEEVLGLTRMQLASYIKEARKKGVPLPKQAPIARSAVSKLEPQTDVIIDLFVEGASLAQMGAILNADQSTVGDFVRRLKTDGVITDEHIAANEARKKSNKQPQRIQEASVFRDRARGYFKEGDLEFIEFRDDRLTERDSKIVEMARNGASNMDIAEEWGLSVRTVSHVMTKARRLGIDVPYATNAQDAPLMERVLRLEEKGMTNGQIAEIIETTVSNVNDVLKRAAEKGLYVPIKDRVIEAWNAGRGVASISEELRRSPAVVRRYLLDAGLIQKKDKSSRYLAPARINKIASYGGASLLDDESLGQSIRTAARMPMAEVDAWVRANATVSESQLGTDTLTVIKFPLTEDPDAPEVMLSIRLKERSNRRDQGRADVNLFLDNQMADALETVEDPVQRGVMAKTMFAKTVMVMRQYAQEYDLKAFNFTAAESQAEGTNAKSREALYRYMLSSLSMPGYTAYEIESQTSIVNRDEDGAKSANPMLGMAGFVIVKDGVNVEDFAKNEILRGSQRGGDAGEVVTVARATPLGRANTGDGGGRGRRGAGAADTGSTLGQSVAPTFYSALGRFIQSSKVSEASAAQWKQLIVQPAHTVRSAKRDPETNRVVLGEDGKPIMLERAVPEVYAPGVKPEEVEWTGVMEWLDLQQGPVTREALAAFVEANGVRVEEVVRGGGSSVSDDAQRRMLPLIERRDELQRELESEYYTGVGPDSMEDAERNAMFALEREVDDLTSQIDNLQRTIDLGLDDAMNDTKWSSFTLPGGENYREMLLTLPKRAVESPGLQMSPEQAAFESRMVAKYGGDFRSIYSKLSGSEIDEHSMLVRISRQRSESDQRERYTFQNFTSSHWSEPNVLAHVRFKERTGPNGERVLALEEVQSDWHQAGRERGYNDAESKARRQQEVDDAKQRGDDAANSAREASERNKGLWDQLRVGGMATQQDMPDAAPMEIARENQRRFRQGLINLGMQPSTYVWLGADDVQNVMREFSDRIDKVARSDSITLEMMFPGLSDYSLLQAIVAAQRDFMSAVASREAAYARMRSLEGIQGVPNAPFKNNAWTELVLKRMIRFAAENGFDAVAWIPGNIQNGRVVETDDNRGDFYDKIVPNAANKIGKKFGARVEKKTFDIPEFAFGLGLHTFPITPELAAAAMTEGFPLFQPGDPKGWGETAPPPDLPPMRLDLARTEEIYGKAAVDALPKAIKDRYRDQTSVDTMLAAARGAAKTLKRKPPKSLFQFIRARKSRAVEGKSVPQKQWGIKGATDELKAMDRADLINEASGIDIDYMRELAEGAGYLPENSTVNDLLNAIDREARGEPVYSEQDANEVLEIQSAQQWADWLSENGVDIFESDQRKLKAAIAKVTRTTNADLKSPDEAAELLGFETGEQLLKALAEAGSREKYIDAETDRRMREEFGDPFASGEFAEAARQAAESEVKFRAAEIEIEALARALGETAASKLAKEMAMDALSVMTVKELAGWERFLEIERREMRNAMKAVQAGDISKALTHKRRQLVNGHLAKAAREKSEALEKTRKDLLTYFTSKGRRDKISRDYLDKIEALLETYELRKSKQTPGVQRKAMSAKEYVDQMVADGREAEIAPEAMLLAAQADKKVWRGLTVDEVEYLAGTVKNLAHLGRTKNSLMKAQDKRRFDAVVAELVDALVTAGPLKGSQREYSFRKTAGEKITSGLRTSHAWLMRMEHQFRALDGKANGPIWNALFRIFADAADVESKMMAETAREVREAYEIYTPLERYKMHNVSISLPELPSKVGKRWTKMEVISMAMNWGVEYNRQALLDGYGWTADQVEAVFARLMTDKDWDFVERVWQVSGKYKTEAFALEKQMTGVEPKSVEGIEFTTASGRKIKGKYFHLEYDGRQLGQRSRRQAQQDAKEALSDRMKSFTKPMTKNGGLINRVGSGGKPVKLHISVFDKAVADTIHDIAYRRAVIDASRIINDPRFADAYEVAAGKEAYEQLMPWIEAIVKPPSDQATGGLAALVAVRRNLPVAYMGYKVGTALIQATGLLAGVPEVGLRWVAQGFAKATVGSPLSLISAYQAVAEKSEMMRDRPMGYDRDVREITTAMGASTPLGAIKRNAFILISGMDLFVSVPVWIGAYDKAMAGKVKGIDAGNDEDAIAYADSVIRRTQTSGRPQDLARVSRDSELWKQVSMLYGYFSNLYGYTSQQVRAVRTGETTPPQFLFYMTIMFVAIPILTELLAGRLLPGDDEDDDETIEEKMGKAVMSNFAGMFPVVRDVVNYQLEPQYGYKLSPVASGMQDVAMTVNAPFDGEMTEGEYRRAVRAMGAIFGLPSSQLVITGDYLADLLSGTEAPLEDPVDAAREALVRDTR